METKVIANWQPSILAKEVIRKEFRELVESLGYVLNNNLHIALEVRDPEENSKLLARSYTAREWHKDGSYFVQHAVLIWSNTLPTEVKFPDGSLLEARGGDVILLDNQTVVHRPPEAALSSKERWFVRAWLVNDGKGVTQDVRGNGGH